ncbi:putative sodium bile acid cotransporter [Papiliotrema laurentii]|uniref:Sodium bile acid cotransporter n=1 Tax=Papiliotrema laurentii TaxID=5418 RepID=A0AAD9CUM3_PAPLA|nr:putative sodium bile acid cotransporter [Papiliotrema laurentii]
MSGHSTIASDDNTPVVPSSEPATKPLWLRIATRTGAFLLEQWLLLAMGLVVLLAYFFPSVGKRGGYVVSEYTVTYGAVAIIFLCSGLTLPFDKLVKHARNIRLHIIVQLTSFLLTSAVFFGIACAAATSPDIETSNLVGFIATGALPTTINSNVVMTRQAGGDVAATMVSVTLGNLLGPFITPLLIAKLYLPSTKAFAQWLPEQALGHLPELYRNVMFQMGLSVYVPLAVGQIVRAIWTKQVEHVVARYRLAKIGSFCLLALIWSTFCTAFASKALQTLTPPTVAFNILTNLAVCVAFTGFAFLCARPPKRLAKLSPRAFRQVDKPEAISICFCAPAKTQALGIPLIAAMYTTADDKTRALIQVPMILYTAEQILVGQVLVWLFKRWLRDDKEEDVETPGAVVEDDKRRPG